MESFYKFCMETSMHGLSQIDRTKSKFYNILWFITFLMAAFGSLVGIFKVFVLYFSSPMSTDYRIVANDSMELPSLSVCALTHLSKSKLRKLGVSRELEEVMYYALGFELSRPELLSKKNVMLWHEYEVLLVRHNLTDFEELLMTLSLPCEEMMGEARSPGSCTIGEREINCCAQSKQYLFPAKCVTIAAKGLMDPKDGYQYVVNLRWPTLDEKFFPSNIAARSRDYTLVMNKGNRGVLGAKEIGRVRPGRMITIKVWMRMYESVNNPPRYSCVDELPHPGYDTDECMEECTLSTIFAQHDSCDCTPAGAFKARQIKTQISNFTGWKELCDPWQLKKCHRQMRRKMQAAASAENGSDNMHERCRDKCPMTCNKIVWNAKMLETVMDPEILEDFFIHSNIQNLSVQEIRANELNSTRVFLTFEGMEYIFTKQQLTMTGGTVLSYLGGQLGLFLGGSLLTFAHCALFMCYTCCASPTKAKLKQKRNSMIRRKSLSSNLLEGTTTNITNNNKNNGNNQNPRNNSNSTDRLKYKNNNNNNNGSMNFGSLLKGGASSEDPNSRSTLTTMDDNSGSYYGGSNNQTATSSHRRAGQQQPLLPHLYNTTNNDHPPGSASLSSYIGTGTTAAMKDNRHDSGVSTSFSGGAISGGQHHQDVMKTTTTDDEESLMLMTDSLGGSGAGAAGGGVGLVVRPPCVCTCQCYKYHHNLNYQQQQQQQPRNKIDLGTSSRQRDHYQQETPPAAPAAAVVQLKQSNDSKPDKHGSDVVNNQLQQRQKNKRHDSSKRSSYIDSTNNQHNKRSSGNNGNQNSSLSTNKSNSKISLTTANNQQQKDQFGSSPIVTNGSSTTATSTVPRKRTLIFVGNGDQV